MPTTVISSAYTVGEPQADGRRYVAETHQLSDGTAMEFEYLADESLDCGLVLSARAQRINDEFAAKEAALLVASGGSLPLDKFEFRSRFTDVEQRDCDEFNAKYESNTLLSAAQKKQIRTGLENFRAVSRIHSNHSEAMAMLGLYEAFGLIAPGRAQEIGVW